MHTRHTYNFHVVPSDTLVGLDAPTLSTTTTNRLTSIPNAAQYTQRSLVSWMKFIGLYHVSNDDNFTISDCGFAYTGNPQ